MSTRYFRTLLFLLFSTVIVAAQEPVITPDTPVDAATPQHWLHSNDPRLIVWAADFARSKHDATLFPAMADWLQHWGMPPIYGDQDWQAMQSREVRSLPILAVLDTLIQENAQVPIPAINAVALSFPAQATILITRHPLSESRETLEDWARGTMGTWSERTLARIALMILAKDPGPSASFWYSADPFEAVGFVGSVVQLSQAKLQIVVNSDGASPPIVGGAACGDSGGRKPTPGWPPVYDYALLDHEPGASNTIVELNGDRISYYRAESNGVALGACHGTTWLDPYYTLHELIAYWLGVKPQDMSWQPQQNFGIKWSGQASYRRRLAEIIESERKKLQVTVEALRQRGFLTEDEATLPAPRLVVTIQCDLKPCPLQ